MQQVNLYTQYCENLKIKNLFRNLPDNKIDHSKLINFSTNDYLGLSKSKRILAAGYAAGKKYGNGSTGPRLLSGNNELFENFEQQIAIDKGTETALIFNSGYQANVSVLSTLCNIKTLKQQAIIFFDKLNHASLYQGAFLSGAHLVRYKHNNIQNLEVLLKKYNADPRPKFIVVETLLGMDGSILPLKKIVRLTKKFNLFLYLDEAHATGVIGNNGYGLSTLIDMQDIPHLIMGSFSKALGLSGAYIACSNTIKTYLINKCPGFIYSTAISPLIIGAAYKAWQIISELDSERKTLVKKAKYLRESFLKLGLNIGTTKTHIIPIILGDIKKTLNIQKALIEDGIIVSAIRPPTVKPNSSRIRIALNINHSLDIINFLINSLKNIL